MNRTQFRAAVAKVERAHGERWHIELTTTPGRTWTATERAEPHRAVTADGIVLLADKLRTASASTP